MTYVSLSLFDLAGAAVFIFINGALSLGFRLGMERSLAVSTMRMCVQLGAIGFVLKFIFAQTSPAWTVGLALIMILVAGREIMKRQETRFSGFWTYGLGTASLLFVGTIGTVFGVGLLIGPDPWYSPRYIIPVLGMILGNTMTGISLGLDTLTGAARLQRAAIEGRIALGATRFEALQVILRRALRTGMMPIINAMAASGIVSLPGMMTGQILSGVDPVEATKYQLLIMFLIAGGTALGVLIAVLGAAWRLTDERHRLRLDRLQRGKR